MTRACHADQILDDARPEFGRESAFVDAVSEILRHQARSFTAAILARRENIRLQLGIDRKKFENFRSGQAVRHQS